MTKRIFRSMIVTAGAVLLATLVIIMGCLYEYFCGVQEQQLKDELSDAEKAAVKAGIKEGLEGLVGKVPGLLEVHVNINGLPTSNADVMLDTTLESFEALKGYAVHPAHVAVADGKVRPYTKTRVCLDYEV